MQIEENGFSCAEVARFIKSCENRYILIHPKKIEIFCEEFGDVICVLRRFFKKNKFEEFDQMSLEDFH